MYGQDLLFGISKGIFQIPLRFLYKLRFQELLDLRAPKYFKMTLGLYFIVVLTL